MNESRLLGVGKGETLVLGVGGCGSNVLAAADGVLPEGVAALRVNSDRTALQLGGGGPGLLLGAQSLSGRGCGGRPEAGFAAAEEARAALEGYLAGRKRLLLIAGLGGGTGSGATPYIARLARELDLETAALVTTPFVFEGRRRAANARSALAALASWVDALTVFPNAELLCCLGGPETRLATLFARQDKRIIGELRRYLRHRWHPESGGPNCGG